MSNFIFHIIIIKKAIIISIIGVMLTFLSCKQDPCEKDWESIWYSETIKIQFLTHDNNALFIFLYNIDSLKMMENGNPIIVNYSQDKRTLEFSLNNFSRNNITSNYNSTIESTVILQYNKQSIDTLAFKAKPIQYHEKCNRIRDEYEFTEIKYNSAIIKTEYRLTCFTCMPLKIKTNH
jgi:hypothetical protein